MIIFSKNKTFFCHFASEVNISWFRNVWIFLLENKTKILSKKIVFWHAKCHFYRENQCIFGKLYFTIKWQDKSCFLKKSNSKLSEFVLETRTNICKWRSEKNVLTFVWLHWQIFIVDLSKKIIIFSKNKTCFCQFFLRFCIISKHILIKECLDICRAAPQ